MDFIYCPLLLLLINSVLLINANVSSSLLGFTDTQLSRLYIGDTDFVDDESSRSAAATLLAEEEHQYTALALIIDINATSDQIISHLNFMRDLIAVRHAVMLFTSDFKLHHIQSIFRNEDRHWNALRHLHIQVDSHKLVHCLDLLRLFPKKELNECTIYIDTLHPALEGVKTPMHVKRLIGLKEELLPHTTEMELVLCREPVQDPNLFAANFEWIKILLYKMNVDQFRLSFNKSLLQNDVMHLEEILKPVWILDSSLSDEPNLLLNQDFLLTFQRFKDKNQTFLFSRNAWIKANRFWVEHAKEKMTQ